MLLANDTPRQTVLTTWLKWIELVGYLADLVHRNHASGQNGSDKKFPASELLDTK